MDSSANPAASLALLAPVTRLSQRIMALPKRTKTMLFAVVAAVVFSAGIFASLVMQPTWRVLYAHLDPADARELSDELTAAKIPFDVSSDGATLRVPADQLDKARLETAGAIVQPMSVAQMKHFVQTESRKYLQVIKESGASAQ